MSQNRPRLSGLSVGRITAALVFLVPLAPSIHSLAPHHDQESLCKHSTRQVHFESAPTSTSEPCPVCTHLSGAQGYIFSSPPRLDEFLSVRSSAPSIRLVLETRAPDRPDSRGPPEAI